MHFVVFFVLALRAAAADGTCTWNSTEGLQYFTEEIIKETLEPDNDSCCANCAHNQDCKFFSYRQAEFRCTLMRSSTGNATVSGVTSGRTPPPPPPAPPGVELRVCPKGCTYSTPSQAAMVGNDLDTIVIEGTTQDGKQAAYNDCMSLPELADRITIKGDKGRPLLFGKACHHKAAIVTNAKKWTVIENIEMAQIAIGKDLGNNGAGIRHQGGDLYVRDCHFHDADEGMLISPESSPSKVIIYNSTFEHVGMSGHAHGIYCNDRTHFSFIKNTITNIKGEGHHVKTRAKNTLVQCNQLEGMTGLDSRNIDVPDAGSIQVLSNVIEKGPGTSMGQFLTYGEESVLRGTIAFVVKDNIFVRDLEKHATMFMDLYKVPSTVQITGNTFVKGNLHAEVLLEVGESKPVPAGNTVVLDRANVSLPSYPTWPNLPAACSNIKPPPFPGDDSFVEDITLV